MEEIWKNGYNYKGKKLGREKKMENGNREM